MNSLQKITTSKKLLVGIPGLVAISAAILGTSGIFAAETVGTVTGKDGDVKDKLSINAEITEVAGSHVTFIDTDTEVVYEASFGPSWFSGEYAVGDEVNIVGVETEEENNENGHNFQVMEVEGVALRDSFEGKPLWAGTRGQGSGNGMGQGVNSGNGNGSRGTNFVDADGDGNCDNL